MLAATLARRFDAMDDGRRRRIERLVLTLDPCDPADFETSIAANLDAALARALPAELARVDAIGPVEDAIDLIAAFLQSGVLPWWATGHAALAEAAETLIVAAASGDRPSVTAALRYLLRATDPAARLVRALPASLPPRLAACMANLPADDLDLLAVTLVAEARDATPAAAALRVWSTILVVAAQEAPPTDAGALGDEVRARLARADGRRREAPQRAAASPADTGTRSAEVEQSPRIFRPAEARIPPEAARDPGDAAEEMRVADDERAMPDPGSRSDPRDEALPRAAPAEGTAQFAVDPVVAEHSCPRPGDAIATVPGREPGDALPDPGEHAARDPAESSYASGKGAPLRRGPADPAAYPAPGDGARAERRIPPNLASAHDTLFIEAAGIILLAPFLPDYFAAAGLVDSERRFVGPAARHRAVMLIDYLATADRDPPESRLALAKLLCGMPIDTLPAALLDDVEAASADALLAAVLAELPMLGRMTVPGLRSAWLNRPGLLTVEHGAWLLRIERRSWDVLLERLPWPIQWLELPWQPERIRVEW